VKKSAKQPMPTKAPAKSERIAAAPSLPSLPVIGVVVFGGGAIGMVLELVGSRLLAPYFGNSLFVWTSLIGVMLGFMSLGYFLGGRLADKHVDTKYLFWILLGAAASVALIAVTQAAVLPALSKSSSVRLFSVISAAILFAIPSTLLGMVSPYCIRLRMHSVEDSGATVGSLYALSTLGSIAGTFAAGFWLISVFGSLNLVMLIAIALALLSLVVMGRRVPWQGVALLALVLSTLGYVRVAVADDTIDTQYDRYTIREIADPASGRPLIGLSRDQYSAESVSYGDTGAPYPFEYYRYYDVASHLSGKKVNKALLIGGGTFSYPRLFVAANPGAKMDVVEIDGALYDIAKSRFGFVDDPRLRLYFEDGRTFLNRADGKYDAVFMDAFKSQETVPYQLVTRETWERCYDLLSDDGVLVMNVIASPKDERKAFFNSLLATIRSVFPEAEAFQVQADNGGPGIQNTSIIAMKRRGADIPAALQKSAPDILPHLYPGYQPPKGTRLFTDDYAPVDQYLLGF